MKSRILALAVALFALSARAEMINIQWNPDGRFENAAEIHGGGFLEVCGKIPSGLIIDWSFTSSAPLESNVHFHEGKLVSYPAKHAAATSVQDRLVVNAEQEYCWMWSNRTPQRIRMNVQLVKAK